VFHKKQTTFIFSITSAKVDRFSNSSLFSSKGSVEEAWIKTSTCPQICCRITLRNVNVQLNSLAFILARTISFMLGDICSRSFYLLICFFFLTLTSITVTLLRYFICCITHAFQLRRYGKRFISTAQSTHPLTSRVHHTKHAYVMKADILNTRGKIICVDRQRNSILVNIYCN